MTVSATDSTVPLRYAGLTVLAALLVLSAKFAAAYVTASVGLFADAMESIVNLVTSVLLVVLLRIAKAPPDEDHPHGHDKAEYFALGVQGTLIILAGAGILLAAYDRFVLPRALEAGALGISLSLLAGIINLGTARLLDSAGKAARSKALRGEAQHLMTDVWTSVAVLAGVGLVYLTHWPWLDPLIALGMSGFIVFIGAKLLRQSVSGLMDGSLDAESSAKVEAVLEGYKKSHGIAYHAVRSRVSGARTFVSLHVLVPGDWTVSRGHALMDEIELAISQAVGGASVLTHLEPIEEASSFRDIEL